MIDAGNPNLHILILAVDKLGRLCDDMVFIGGSATGLLITDPAAPPVRETRDVDVLVEITSRADYYKLSDKLRAIGFREDQGDGAPLCRWVSGELILDVMPTDSNILGFSNSWYPSAFSQSVNYKLPNNRTINIATAPCFLATKIEAFHGRGGGDYLLSHDLEDLVLVVDGRPELVDEVKRCDDKLREFLAGAIKTFLDDPRFVEALPGKLPGDESNQARIQIIVERLEALRHL